MYNNGKIMLLTGLFTLFSLRCTDDPKTPATANGGSHAEETAQATNRVDVSETVRRNLGITFAKVESRPVAQTIRVPGRFELQPQARREYRTMLAGRVELLVKQYDTVAAGTLLYRLESSEWRELQQKLSDSIAAIHQAEARADSIAPLMAAHRKHRETLQESVVLWEKRVEQVSTSTSSGAVSIEELTNIQNSLATKRVELAEVFEKGAELEAQSTIARAEHDSAHARLRLLLSTASTLLGIGQRELSAPYDLDQHLHTDADVDRTGNVPTTQPAPRWQEINEIEVKATTPGIVESVDLTNGAWASTGSLVVATIEPDRLRFRARGMQSDLGRLRDDLPARIVPPKGGTIELQDTMDATLRIGLLADPEERTLDLIAVPARIADWAKAGVSGHLEVITAGGTPEMAVPLSSVIQDGLEKIIFRRDPKNPDKVIRMEADLGVNDGRWVVVNSGIMEGDEVVLDGVYQLMIATSGSVEKGGHFHADGSFHGEEDKK